MKNQRKLTVQSQYQQTNKNSSIVYPSLKLSGKWLQESGFTPQDKVQVTVKQGVLVIELLK